MRIFIRIGVALVFGVFAHSLPAQVNASFSHSQPVVACFPNPLTVSFSSTTTGNPVSLLWKFINPAGQVFSTSTLPAPTMSFSGVGQYTIRLIATGANGQQDSASLAGTVEIYGQPTVNITSAGAQGCLPLSVPLVANGTAGPGASIAGYQWAFAPANFPALSGANPTLNVSVPGTYSVQVTLTDSHGCIGTASSADHIVAYPPLRSCLS